MPKNISLDEFMQIQAILELLKKIKLLKPIDFIITWEKKPQLTINRLGEFEFANPQEIYGCTVSFWDPCPTQLKPVSQTRFNISDR